MFGYRLIREKDYDAQQARFEALSGRIDKLTDDNVALLMQLANVKAIAAAKTATNDHMKTRLNVVELEAAHLRNKMTGVPAIAPQIGTGNPLSAEGIGAGADLFEDVGDTRAAELEATGMIEAADRTDFPSAADLSDV